MLKLLFNAGLSAFIAACCASGAARAEDTRSCRIDRVAGPGLNLQTSSATSSPEPGQEIPPDAVLETGAATRAVVICSDGTTITLGPSSTLALGDLIGPAGRDRNVLMRLINGITGIVAPNRTWDRFEVETSVAIASVRSTEWLVESQPETGTSVFVASGLVDVRTDRTDYALAEGEGISFEPPSKGRSVTPAKVQTWGADRVARTRAALGFDWE